MFNYFEPTELTYTKISPACTRLHIANKVVFVVHKKNNEYCRTGPFTFKSLNLFFEKLYTFDSTTGINSDGGGCIHTIAYIDVYS